MIILLTIFLITFLIALIVSLVWDNYKLRKSIKELLPILEEFKANLENIYIVPKDSMNDLAKEIHEKLKSCGS